MGCAGCGFKDIVSGKEHNLFVSEEKSSNCNKLNTFDWLKDLPDTQLISDIVEIRFKNTRKEFFKNTNKIHLKIGDVVTVGASSGFDVGVVSLTGRLAQMQMKRKEQSADENTLRIIFRKASTSDMQSSVLAKSLELPYMVKSRQVAIALQLDMKISDVEIQSDKTKATFYYVAEGRVDFRELIKVLAEQFKMKIVMRQIGARQEAGRIGGVGSCGRELCCSSWRTSFPPVKTIAAIKQNLSAVNEKLMGQCGKLKCCLMYELDTYIEAREDFPLIMLELETKQGIAYPYKIDILKKTVWYSFDAKHHENAIEIPLQIVKDIILMNKKGQQFDNLASISLAQEKINFQKKTAEPKYQM